MNKQVSFIGSGFASISAACYLAKSGYEVNVYEKNAQLGGRARQFVQDGFKFDMGPTWYWMPDVFERFFADFGKKPSDYYQLERLGPAYRVYFGEQDFMDISDDLDEIKETFEKIEPGAANALTTFMKKAAKNYEVAIKDLVYKPGLSPFEFVDMVRLVSSKPSREMNGRLMMFVASEQNNKTLPYRWKKHSREFYC